MGINSSEQLRRDQLERVGHMISQARALRKKLQSDRHRPRYHFVSPEGVCKPFDPNGALFWQGRYHLFYIFQDSALPHRGHCWGHVSSVDLVHWTHHPTALAPHPDDPEVGIFSGCALISKEGRPTLVYLGVDAGICVATSKDRDMIEWTKSPANPVIPIPKEGDPEFGRYTVHDPHVWLQRDTYYAILNGRREWDTAYLFKSPDLIQWEYLHPFYSPNPKWTEPEEDCACPDFFPLGDRHVLLCISHKYGCRYYVGTYNNEAFTPEKHARMNWRGGPCFAPESLLDERGRRIFWAWVRDLRPPKVASASGWAGVMTLPRVLSAGPQDTVHIEPADELSALRLNEKTLEDTNLCGEIILHDVTGDSMELLIEMEPKNGTELGVILRRSPDGEEQTIVGCDLSSDILSINVSRSTLDPSIKYPTVCTNAPDNGREELVQRAPFVLRRGEHLRLRVFLDRSIVEVFANERQCITQRIYPTRADSMGIALYSRGGTARVVVLKAWQMAATNPW